MTPQHLTREAARAFDRHAIETLNIPHAVLMENAGRGCVDRMQREGIGGPVVVLCGKGNNGGDGFVIARHLAIRGYKVRVVLASSPSKLIGDAMWAFDALTHCGVAILDEAHVNPALSIQELDAFAGGSAWIVDSLLGSGATGAPRPPYDTMIDWINAETGRRLAVDLPSGLDCDTGEPRSPTVRADVTCTFVAPKAGFMNKAAQPYLGEVHVCDIGAPS